ncbi:MAG: hypothetical protein KGQ70_05120, partial [Alphaproteobacteria bacterium]|nr:hypothetical protein [Alphaproteobacteria bacterium]
MAGIVTAPTAFLGTALEIPARMDFPAFDFSTLSEADIREEIVAPLLKSLGYRSGTENNIIREQTLRYPHISLG